jgi:choice-of-anchor B domain-containing protein
MEATAEWDEGRTVMQKIMIAKEESWKRTAECIKAGTCPELAKMPIAGDYVCTGGMAGDIPCSNVDQLSFLTFAQMGGVFPGDTNPQGNDVWGWTDPQTGKEYAIMGFTGGTAFVDISDPKVPVPVGFIQTATVRSSWRDIKVIGNYAYIVAEAARHGLQVFDLTRLRGRTTIATFQPDAINEDFGQAHNIVSNSDTNFLYVVGSTSTAGYPRVCRGGLMVINVANPLQPTYAGCFGDDGYVHDAQCVVYHGPDARYTGREICICFNENSLTIVDVTNKNGMTLVAKSGYVNVAYTHQGWFTDDHSLILLDDEQDEYRLAANQQFTKTYVWDVSNLQQLNLRSIFQSTERSIDHNQYIIGNLAYQGNYESGLRILNINSATQTLNQVGYFDAYPARTTSEFNGVWSVFPYYRSGVVAVSSINHGLFIVKPNMNKINELIASEETYAEQTRTRTIIPRIAGAICPAQLETRVCQVQVLC